MEVVVAGERAELCPIFVSTEADAAVLQQRQEHLGLISLLPPFFAQFVKNQGEPDLQGNEEATITISESFWSEHGLQNPLAKERDRSWCRGYP